MLVASPDRSAAGDLHDHLPELPPPATYLTYSCHRPPKPIQLLVVGCSRFEAWCVTSAALNHYLKSIPLACAASLCLHPPSRQPPAETEELNWGKRSCCRSTDR